MRIAYVTETYPPEINGVALTVARTIQFLRGRAHQVELIRPRQQGEAPRHDDSEWRTAGMPIPMYPELRCGIAGVRALAERFSSMRPDAVHIATPGPLGRAALLAAGKLGLPVTTDFRTNFHAYSHYYGIGWLQPLICHYLRAFHNRSQRTFVPSQMVLRELTALGFKRLEVIGRGVDSELFSSQRRSAELRSAWGVVDDEDLVMLHVGRLAREKNITLALHAYKLVRYLRPKTRMVVVGDGPMRRQLEADFPSVHFVGTLRGEELARHYASADVFVFPSYSETFGNVTLEALASGLAVIAFNGAAAAEHIVDGENGLLVPPGDHSAFLDAVCRCAVMGEDLLAPLRLRARETALRTTWDKALGAFEHRLLQLVSAPARRHSPHVAVA